MIDISGFGVSVTIIALSSFPQGFELTTFADDKDPLSAEEVETTAYEELFDGSLFFFDKTAPIKVEVNVVAGSDDDINMKILLQTRKGAAKIIPIPDVTSMIVSYPDGGRVMLTNGSIVKGPLLDSITTDHRRKGNTYTFVFGSFAGAQSATELVSTIAQTAMSFL
jgi:hypothetical protein